MIKKLNEKARVVVKTPVGDTEEFVLEEIVRQGSVYGNQICIASMDRINYIGKDITTFYGPNLPIRAVTFVDDVTASGGDALANNVIYNCHVLEEQKKFTFNNKNGKTEYLIIGEFEEDMNAITSCVKRGTIQLAKEHKVLGSWFDSSGNYGINTEKRKEKLNFMIGTTKTEAHPRNVGRWAVDGRLKLAEVVVLQSILYNSEAFHEHTKDEMHELEKIQHTILTKMLELPSTTPYYPLLMETGWWLVCGKMAYRKLMLCQNILTSDNRRVTKKLLHIQQQEGRETTWYSSVKREIEKYKIELNPAITLKSTWKKHVKTKINTKMDELIREKCITMTKGRLVRDDEYIKKEYLCGTDIREVKKILRVRLHMSSLPGNYKGGGDGTCPLCNEGKGNIEHYIDCHHTKRLANVWGVEVNDLRSQDINTLSSVGNFTESVEELIQPLMVHKLTNEPSK